jgi:RNA polymerase sigma-70 factor (ECF subfamily)
MTQSQFKDLYDNNENALFNFARKLTRNDYLAKDLVQETVIKAYRSKHTFRPGTSFKSWSFTILKNTFITLYNKRRKRAVVNTSVEDMSYALESQQSVPNEAESCLRVAEMKKHISRLSTKSRKPFMMFVIGYKYSEIAEQLSIPIGTVKSRINFARTKLQSQLQQYKMSA